MARAMLTSRRALKQCARSGVFYFEILIGESVPQFTAVTFHASLHKGGLSSKMVAKPLQQAVFTSYGAADVPNTAPRMADEVDTLRVRNVEALPALRELMSRLRVESQQEP